MSDTKDLIPLENVQLPEYLRSFESELSTSMVTQAESWPRISLRGKQFRFKKDGEEHSLSMGQPLKIVILLADPLGKGCAKSYYADAYASGSDDAPDCTSADGILPDDFSSNKQCETCAGCQHNEWGSAVDSNGNPGKGKACNDVKRLFVVAPNNPAGDIFLLQVPPASLKELSIYARDLIKHNVPVEGIVTTVQFVDSEFPQIDFKFGGFLPEDMAKAAIARSKSDEITAISNQSTPALAAPVKEPEVAVIAKGVVEETGEFDGFDGFGDDTPPQGSAAVDPNLTIALSPAEVKRAKLMAELAALDGDKEPIKEPVPVDKAGEEWNPARHAANRAKTGKGFWAKLRGAAKVEPKPKVEAAAESGFFDDAQTEIPKDDGSADALSSVLDEWG